MSAYKPVSAYKNDTGLLIVLGVDTAISPNSNPTIRKIPNATLSGLQESPVIRIK